MATGIFSGLQIPKRKVFVSYHHGGDLDYYNAFTTFFSNNYDVIQDNSVDRVIDSDNVDYVIRNIRESYITGTSCTIVLCGLLTPYRKFVDWEIKATLDKQHSLIGINLPNNPLQQSGAYIVPDRLHDNIVSGYALWLQWNDLNNGPAFLVQKIEEAKLRQKNLIVNSRDLRKRNG